MTDIPAIVALAHVRDVPLIDDSTRATALFNRSFDQGVVGVAMQAAH